MNLSAAVPVIRILSFEQAKEFYLDYLGFDLEWEYRFEDGFPLYAEIRRGDLTLHLTEHDGDAMPGSTIVVPVEDIDALYRELMAKEHAYATHGLEAAEWGWQFQVTDPFGNRFRFCEIHGC